MWQRVRAWLGLDKLGLDRLGLAQWGGTLGQRGERAAARYLRSRGYKIVAAGDRTMLGELDLVAVDGRTVVFVEVKTRESHEAGHPVEAVDADKQARLTRLALAYLKRHDLLECRGPVRRDRDHLARACRQAADRALCQCVRADRPRADVQLTAAWAEPATLARRAALG